MPPTRRSIESTQLHKLVYGLSAIALLIFATGVVFYLKRSSRRRARADIKVFPDNARTNSPLEVAPTSSESSAGQPPRDTSSQPRNTPPAVNLFSKPHAQPSRLPLTDRMKHVQAMLLEINRLETNPPTVDMGEVSVRIQNMRRRMEEMSSVDTSLTTESELNEADRKNAFGKRNSVLVLRPPPYPKPNL